MLLLLFSMILRIHNSIMMFVVIYFVIPSKSTECRSIEFTVFVVVCLSDTIRVADILTFRHYSMTNLINEIHAYSQRLISL